MQTIFRPYGPAATTRDAMPLKEDSLDSAPNFETPILFFRALFPIDRDLVSAVDCSAGADRFVIRILHFGNPVID